MYVDVVLLISAIVVKSCGLVVDLVDDFEVELVVGLRLVMAIVSMELMDLHSALWVMGERRMAAPHASHLLRHEILGGMGQLLLQTINVCKLGINRNWTIT